MYISYFNKGIRYENLSKHSELRIHAPKIGSRFFSTYSDFTYDITPKLKLVTSKMYKNNVEYDKLIQQFLLGNPYTTKMYAVVRNPKKRLISAIAQIIYVNNVDIDMHSACIKLYNNFREDVHLSSYLDYLYHFISGHEHNIVTNRLKNESITIEDLDEMTYHTSRKNSLSDGNSNSKLYDKVYQLLEYIRNNKEFDNLQKYIYNYIETESDYYYKIKNYSNSLDNSN